MVFIRDGKYPHALTRIKVKTGDTVKTGKVLALCGNSGNSSEPQLEYFLMNTDKIENATGIKIYFEKLIRRRKREETEEKMYSPVRDDYVKAE